MSIKFEQKVRDLEKNVAELREALTGPLNMDFEQRLIKRLDALEAKILKQNMQYTALNARMARFLKE